MPFRPLPTRSRSQRKLQTRKRNRASRRQRPSHVRASRLEFQTLEPRQMLAIPLSGSISGVLNDTSQPYCLTGNVTVDAGAILVINPGVTIESPSFRRIDVSGSLFADGVDFTGQTRIEVKSNGRLNLRSGSTVEGDLVEFENGSSGNVADSFFTSAHLNVESVNVVVNRNTFSNSDPVSTKPSVVREFFDNTFTVPNSTLKVGGTTDFSVNWNPINNVIYELDQTVSIPAGLSINIKPGVEINTPFSFQQFDVDGTLRANDVDFTGATAIDVAAFGKFVLRTGSTLEGNSVRFRENSTGNVAGNAIDNIDFILQSKFVFVNNNTFTGTTPVTTGPSIINEFYDNTFATPNSVFSIEGSADEGVAWIQIPNISRYLITGTVTVESGVNLAIFTGVQVESEFTFNPLTIRGTVFMASSSFVGDSNTIRVESGGRFTAINQSSLSGSSIDYREGSFGNLIGGTIDVPNFEIFSTDVFLRNNTFAQIRPLTVGAMVVPKIYNNTFNAQSTVIEVRGTVDSNVEWDKRFNISAYELASSVTVNSGATLRIDFGNEIRTPNFASFTVNGMMVANGVDFVGSRSTITVRNGGTLNMRSSTSFTGDTLSFQDGSSGIIDFSTINADIDYSDDSTMIIRNNSLLTGVVTAIGSNSAVIDMTNNFWGTTNTNLISSRITDLNDSSFRPLVDFQPFLNSPPNDGGFRPSQPAGDPFAPINVAWGRDGVPGPVLGKFGLTTSLAKESEGLHGHIDDAFTDVLFDSIEGNTESSIQRPGDHRDEFWSGSLAEWN